MIKKTITYTNYKGEKKTDTRHFHLKRVDAMRMQTSVEGGLDEYIKKIAESNNNHELIKLFEEVLLMSVGEISEDGEFFDQSPEVVERFKKSAAYDEFFFDLASDADKAAEFFNNLLPEDIRERADEMAKDQDKPTGPPKLPAKKALPTRQDLLEMTPEEFQAYARGDHERFGGAPEN